MDGRNDATQKKIFTYGGIHYSMNNSLQVFNNGGFTARTITDDNGEIWFVAKDIAEALGYNLDGGAGNAVPYGAGAVFLPWTFG